MLKRKMCFNDGRVIFGVAGPNGGVHYWRNNTCKEWPGMSGLEEHRLTKPYEGAVSHKDCWLIGGPCYHDGSSLYAQEVYNPIFDACNNEADFESLWRRLEGEYRERFEEECS